LHKSYKILFLVDSLIKVLLIILRSPAGSGKSEVCCGLRKRIENEKSIKSCFLNLDETCHEKFEIDMKKALENKYVIGEMFYGNGHTSNLETWINRFKDKDYNIFSFILKASVDTCLQRCKNDEKKNRSDRYEKERKIHEGDHRLFYKCLECVNFAKNVSIFEEIIDTETKSIQVVAIIYLKIKSSID
jgi:hypothetical protein